jgi:hypothetical protein
MRKQSLLTSVLLSVYLAEQDRLPMHASIYPSKHPAVPKSTYTYRHTYNTSFIATRIRCVKGQEKNSVVYKSVSFTTKHLKSYYKFLTDL